MTKSAGPRPASHALRLLAIAAVAALVATLAPALAPAGSAPGSVGVAEAAQSGKKAAAKKAKKKAAKKAAKKRAAKKRPKFTATKGMKVHETGRVRAIADGDTFWIDLAGDRSRKRYLVRLAGIQATETKHRRLKGSRNECHGRPAKKALRKLVLGKKVKLRSAHRSSRAGKRLLRFAYVKKQGRWTDVQALLLYRSKVMSHNFKRESRMNVRYSTLAQRAAVTGRGMWNTDACGYGPQQTVPLHMWVHWDAQGPDLKNLRDQYVVIENRSPVETLRIGRWQVRDTSHATYTFPASAAIAPGSFVRLRVGRGTDTATDFHWGLRKSQFQNPGLDGQGDIAVLKDRQGDFRAWANYPCRHACAEPLRGVVEITDVEWDPDGNDNHFVNGEQIVLANRTNHDVSLSGYYVLISGWLSYTFPPGRTMRAGEVITILMGRGVTTRDTIHLQQDASHLPNAGGTVEVRNWNGNRVTCVDWGRKSC